MLNDQANANHTKSIVGFPPSRKFFRRLLVNSKLCKWLIDPFYMTLHSTVGRLFDSGSKCWRLPSNMILIRLEKNIPQWVYSVWEVNLRLPWLFDSIELTIWLARVIYLQCTRLYYMYVCAWVTISRGVRDSPVVFLTSLEVACICLYACAVTSSSRLYLKDHLGVPQ